MPQALDDLIADLQRKPLDRSLDGVAADVGAEIAEQAAANTQTWRLRTTAVLLVAVGGAFASASTAAVAAPKPLSPFAVWSSLAPSTLLEPGG